MPRKFSEDIEEEAIEMINEGMTNAEISRILGVSTTWLYRKRIEKGLPASPRANISHDIDNETIEEAIHMIKDGLTDTEISKILGITRDRLRKIRKNKNLPPSSGKKKTYSNDEINDVIDLIREGSTITEISKITKIHNKKIREIRDEEIRDGNLLPDFKKGISRTQKYDDEEIIDLVYLNPGFGFFRFIEQLGITENFTMELFLDYKEFTSSGPLEGGAITNNPEDLLEVLQDPSFNKKMTWHEYKIMTGENKIPNKYKIYGGGNGRRGSEEPDKHRFVSVPPQNFNWGNITKKYYRDLD